MGKKQVFGKCRLCLEDKRLVDSHIIPDLHFKPLKEMEGHFLKVSTNPEKKEIKAQKGFTEYLFCGICDNERLQKNEAHLAHVLFHKKDVDATPSDRFLTIRGYDYKKIKNGLLSILWRMSISSRPEFSEIDLGPKHEEAIRVALLNDDLFEEEEYPVLVTAPVIEGQFYADMILAPDCVRVGSNRACRCLISGLLFTFFVGSAPLSAVAQPYILRKNAWQISVVPVENIPFLNHAFMRLAKANAIRKKRSDKI